MKDTADGLTDLKKGSRSVASALGQNEKVITRIRPSRGWRFLDFGELWAYRELLFFLSLRDIKVRYKQTILGIAWAVLQPVLVMVVFSVFFGRLAGVPSEDRAYPIFTLTGLVPWFFFSNALSMSANSVVQSAGLITKVYFPKILVPVASVSAGVIDLALSFCVLLAMIPFFSSFAPSWRLLMLPGFTLLLFFSAAGVGIWFAALNVKFRDIRYVLPFMTQIWLFVSPIAYPSSLLSEPWRTVYAANPLVGVVEGFRWALLGTSLPGQVAVVSAVSALLLFVSSLLYFAKVQETFADLV